MKVNSHKIQVVCTAWLAIVNFICEKGFLLDLQKLKKIVAKVHYHTDDGNSLVSKCSLVLGRIVNGSRKATSTKSRHPINRNKKPSFTSCNENIIA